MSKVVACSEKTRRQVELLGKLQRCQEEWVLADNKRDQKVGRVMLIIALENYIEAVMGTSNSDDISLRFDPLSNLRTRPRPCRDRFGRGPSHHSTGYSPNSSFD